MFNELTTSRTSGVWAIKTRLQGGAEIAGLDIDGRQKRLLSRIPVVMRDYLPIN